MLYFTDAFASDMTWYWAHHEKFIVIDYEIAFVGGLDLCFGRWDNNQHPLADIHPTDVRDEVWPGQDFNNNRIMDFQNVESWQDNELSKADFGRMPWHDVAMCIQGMSTIQHQNFPEHPEHPEHPKLTQMKALRSMT